MKTVQMWFDLNILLSKNNLETRKAMRLISLTVRKKTVRHEARKRNRKSKIKRPTRKGYPNSGRLNDTQLSKIRPFTKPASRKWKLVLVSTAPPWKSAVTWAPKPRLRFGNRRKQIYLPEWAWRRAPTARTTREEPEGQLLGSGRTRKTGARSHPRSRSRRRRASSSSSLRAPGWCRAGRSKGRRAERDACVIEQGRRWCLPLEPSRNSWGCTDAPFAEIHPFYILEKWFFCWQPTFIPRSEVNNYREASVFRVMPLFLIRRRVWLRNGPF